MQEEKEPEKIVLPAPLYDRLECEKVEVVSATAEGLELKPVRERKYYTLGWIWWVIPTVVTLGYFAYMNFTNSTTLYFAFSYDPKGVSIANWVMYALKFFTLPVFMVAYLAKYKEFQRRLTPRLYWLSIPLLGYAFFTYAGELPNMVFDLIGGEIFVGTRFNKLTTAIMLIAIMGLANYLIIGFLNHFTLSSATTALVTIITLGVIWSILLNGQSGWWKAHFSSLGSAKSKGNTIFNYTLLFTGLILAMVFDFLVTQLKKKYKEIPGRLRALRVLLVLCGLSIAGVAVPNNGNRAGGWPSQVHNAAAGLIVLFLVVVMVGIFYFLPMVDRDFKIFTYATLGGLLVVVFLFYGAGLFLGGRLISLTTFELLSFAIAFVWIFSFIGKMNQLANFDETVYRLEKAGVAQD